MTHSAITRLGGVWPLRTFRRALGRRCRVCGASAEERGVAPEVEAAACPRCGRWLAIRAVGNRSDAVLT